MEIIEGNYLSHEFLGRLERVGRSSEHLLRDYTHMVMYCIRRLEIPLCLPQDLL